MPRLEFEDDLEGGSVELGESSGPPRFDFDIESGASLEAPKGTLQFEDDLSGVSPVEFHREIHEDEPSVLSDILDQALRGVAEIGGQLGKATLGFNELLTETGLANLFMTGPLGPFDQEQRRELLERTGEDPYVLLQDNLDRSLSELPEAETTPGDIVRPTVKFLAAFVPATKMMSLLGTAGAVSRGASSLGMSESLAAAVGTAAQVEIAGLVAGQAVFDPHEERLSNLLQEVPGLEPIFSQIAADPDDPEVLARAKLAVEDLVVMAPLSEALIRAMSGAARSMIAAGRKTLLRGTARGAKPSEILEDIPLGELLPGGENAALRFRVAEMETALVRMAEENPEMSSDQLRQTLQNFMDQQDPDGKILRASTKEKILKRLEGRLGGKGRPEEDAAEAVLRPIHKSREVRREKSRITTNKMLSKARTLLFDHAGNVKDQLLKQAGEAGEEAKMRFELAAGASARADLQFKRARSDIFGPLQGESSPITGLMSTENMQNLNEIIQVSRGWNVKASRPDIKVNNFDPSLKAHEQALRDIRERVGSDTYAQLIQRADRYFDVMREQLEQLRDAGIVTQEEYLNLADFQYQPRQMLDILDPIIEMQFGSQKKTVSSSGVEPLGRGGQDLLIDDAQFLLANVISRTQGRVARNRATASLGTVAEEVPENGFIFSKRPKEGEYTGLSYLEGGKKKVVYMESELAAEWITLPAPFSKELGAILSTLSGAPLVRAFATGINPEFALVNLPRDIVFSWMTTKEFSPALPLAMIQHARNLATVLPDTIRRSGRYEDYIQQGGGMSFLTHGARLHTATEARGRFGVAWERTRDVLGFFNESAEILTRLSVREQALRNGKSPEEATHVARNYLDFSQGGSATKGVDVMIPFLNASVQGLRGAARAAKTDPVTFGSKAMQLMGASAALWMYNHYHHREVMTQVSEEERARYYIIPTGMSYIDDGDIRHLYARIPVDHTVMPLKAITDAMMDRAIYGTIPDRQIVESFANMMTVLGDPGTAFPPTLRAMAQYLSNYDFWLQDDIWKGPQVSPEAEVKRFPQEPTAQISVDVAEALSPIMELSPARLQSASSAVLPRNVFLSLFNKGYEAIRGGPQVEMEKFRATEDVLRRYPGVRRVVGVTHPLANSLNDIEELELQQSDLRLSQNQRIDELAMKSFTAGERVRKGENWRNALSFIESQPALDRQRLIERFDRIKWANTIVERLRDPALGPLAQSKTWWIVVGGLDPVTRAEVVYNEWRATEPEARPKLERMIFSMPAVAGDRFAVEFGRLQKERGKYFP